MSTWRDSTLAKSEATLNGDEVLRVIDTPSATPASKKTTINALASFTLSSQHEEMRALGWHDVTDPLYGAVGDGVTDDTDAIQSAIDAAGAAGAGVVYIPPLTFIVNLDSGSVSTSSSTFRVGALTMPYDNVMIVGEGPGLSVLKCQTGGVHGVIQFAELPLQNGTPKIYNSGMRGLTLDGNYDSGLQAASTGQPNFHGAGLVDCVFDNVTSQYASHYGFAYQNGGHINTRCTRLRVYKTGQDGFDIKNNQSSSTLLSANFGLIFDACEVEEAGRGYSPADPYAMMDIDGIGVSVINFRGVGFPTDYDSGSGNSSTCQVGIRVKQGLLGDRLGRGIGGQYINIVNATINKRSGDVCGDYAIEINAPFASVTNCKGIGPFVSTFMARQPCHIASCVADGATAGFSTGNPTGPAASTRTVTVTIASPGVFTGAGHGLVAGNAVTLTTSGALPTGLAVGTTYYVLSTGLTTDEFQVSTTPTGSAVNTSGSQSGTHTATGPIGPFLYTSGGEYVTLMGVTARNCTTGIVASHAQTRLFGPFLDTCTVGINMALSSLSGNIKGAAYRNCGTNLQVNSVAVTSTPNLSVADGVIERFARSGSQYIDIAEDSGGNRVISYSSAGAAKQFLFNSTTDESNTSVSAGAVGFIYQVLSTTAMQIDGNRNVVLGRQAALATNATNDHVYIPSCAGTPTGTPTAFTGKVPIIVDTSNHKLYFYSGATWRDAGP